MSTALLSCLEVNQPQPSSLAAASSAKMQDPYKTSSDLKCSSVVSRVDDKREGAEIRAELLYQFPQEEAWSHLPERQAHRLVPGQSRAGGARESSCSPLPASLPTTTGLKTG